MATFNISDGMDGSIDITPNNNSALTKYFKNLSNLSVDGALLALRKAVTLDDPAIKSVNAGVTFSQPVSVGTSQVDLKIGGGVNGHIGIFKPDGSNSQLFDPDPYEDPIPVLLTDRFVSFGFTANVNADVAGGAGDLKFGFAAGASVDITNYRPFSVQPSAPTLLDAVTTTLSGFVIPGDIEDLHGLPSGSVVTLNGSGSLKFSATANLLTAVNPLASVGLPAPLPTVSLKAGGSVCVGADVQLTGEYQVRVTKVGPQQVRLAYYRKSGREFDIKTKASFGVSAEVGDSEVLTSLMSAISSDPKTDQDELKKAGLPAEQTQAIEDAVKASIARTIEVALTAELAVSRQEKAIFVYDLDLSLLTPVSHAAIRSALKGDLSVLTKTADASLPGIRPAKDLFTSLRESKHSWTVNLLGVVNFGRVSTLMLSGRTLFEPATGQLVMSDTVTASRIESTVVNLGVADADKLRRVIAESFLVTVAYRGARSAGLQPSIETSQSFFALNQHTSQETLKDELDVSVALGLIATRDQQRIVMSVPDFGRTLYYAATHYDNTLATELFVADKHPLSVDTYEKAGLQALACLVHSGDMDDARLRPAQNETLWKAMKSAGQPGIPALFQDVPAPIVQAIVADYSVIRWWSDAMSATAAKLVAMQEFLATHPTADDQNDAFKKLRSDLTAHLKSVAADTKDEFGRPWGLLAMFIVSGQQAARKATLVGPGLYLTNEVPTRSLSIVDAA